MLLQQAALLVQPVKAHLWQLGRGTLLTIVGAGQIQQQGVPKKAVQLPQCGGVAEALADVVGHGLERKGENSHGQRFAVVPRGQVPEQGPDEVAESVHKAVRKRGGERNRHKDGVSALPRAGARCRWTDARTQCRKPSAAHTHPEALLRSQACMLVPMKKRLGTLTLSQWLFSTGRRPSFFVSGLMALSNMAVLT